MTKMNESLRGRLRDFAAGHPHGWEHHDWLGLLSELSEAGMDVSDAETIGASLEEQRLDVVLESLDVRGLGPKRRQAVVSRFERLWDLRQASVDDLKGLPSFHRGLAQALHDALH